jgi:hypothetical protein
VRHFIRNYLSNHPELVESRKAEYRKEQQVRFLSFMIIATMVLIALVFF